MLLTSLLIARSPSKPSLSHEELDFFTQTKAHSFSFRLQNKIKVFKSNHIMFWLSICENFTFINN